MSRQNRDWQSELDSDEPLNGSMSDSYTIHRTKGRGKMPVSSEAKAKSASKDTWRSSQVAKKVAKKGGGMRNRRKRRMN